MKDFSTFVENAAAQVVEAFQSEALGGLDYSERSLELIESLLDRLSREDDLLQPSRTKFLVEGFGCYIFEVARREFGGKFEWYNKLNQPVLIVGEPKFHVAMLAWDKVAGRLKGDQADNIPFFYSGFAERTRQAKPGDRALYV